MQLLEDNIHQLSGVGFVYSKGHFQVKKIQVWPIFHKYSYYSVLYGSNKGGFYKALTNILHHVASSV